MIEPEPMILPLPRPQYLPMPEAFISALAWKLFSVESVENSSNVTSDVPMARDPKGKPIGLMYRSEGSASRVISVKPTLPVDARLASFETAIRASGLRIEGPSSRLSGAILNSVDGVRIEKSGSQPASPITPAFALLQNLRGVLGVKGPPDMAQILETMFALGSGESSESMPVARMWLEAANHRMKIDPLLSALDAAVDASVLGAPRVAPAHIDVRSDMLSSEFAGTPFEWFASAWRRLTSDEWVEALPARVWVDWATAVLRVATGLGFLWEVAWYETLAQHVLQDSDADWVDVRKRVVQVLPWRSSRSGSIALDVAPLLVGRVHRGDRIRTRITAWKKAHDVAGLSFKEIVTEMRADVELMDDLTGEMGSRTQTGSGKNLWEAVKYALRTRESTSARADYYGLLQSNGRYLTVSPGTEWIAVVASLSCGSPGTSTHVGQVLADLQKLGMRPELGDLIALLERAGMARGSADADQGVIVESAY